MTTTTPTEITLSRSERTALGLLADEPCTVGSSTNAEKLQVFRNVAQNLIASGYASQDGEGQPLLITHAGRAALAIANGEPAPNPDDANGGGTLDLPASGNEPTAPATDTDESSDVPPALGPRAHYVTWIPIDDLHEVGHNRDLGDLSGLADSIKRFGVLQPIRVRGISGRGYEIIFGARRTAAARLAGETLMPCIVDEELNDADVEFARIIENIQRLDPSPLEEADAYDRLTKPPFKMTATAIADAVGRSESHISKRRSLLVLPDPARDALVDGRINIQTALGITALAKDKPSLDAAVAALPSAKSSGQKLEYERQTLERTIAAKIAELDRLRKLEALTKELEAAGETILPWDEWTNDHDEKWRQVDDGEPHEAVVIVHRDLRVLKITTQPEPPAANAARHRPPKPEGDIGFVEQARIKKQQHLDQLAEPRRQIITNLLTGAGDDDILREYIADEVAAILTLDGVLELYQPGLALELLGLREDVAQSYQHDRNTFAEYASRTTLTRLRATTAALMAPAEGVLTSPSEKRDAAAWALDPDDEYVHSDVRRHLAFLERHGYDLNDEERTAITPVEPEADDDRAGTETEGS